VASRRVCGIFRGALAVEDTVYCLCFPCTPFGLDSKEGSKTEIPLPNTKYYACQIYLTPPHQGENFPEGNRTMRIR
jgi:hypothetical protein